MADAVSSSSVAMSAVAVLSFSLMILMLTAHSKAEPGLAPASIETAEAKAGVSENKLVPLAELTEKNVRPIREYSAVPETIAECSTETVVEEQDPICLEEPSAVDVAIVASAEEMGTEASIETDDNESFLTQNEIVIFTDAGYSWVEEVIVERCDGAVISDVSLGNFGYYTLAFDHDLTKEEFEYYEAALLRLPNIKNVGRNFGPITYREISREEF